MAEAQSPGKGSGGSQCDPYQAAGQFRPPGVHDTVWAVSSNLSLPVLPPGTPQGHPCSQACRSQEAEQKISPSGVHLL